MRILGLILALALCSACGKKLGPGKTPKETIRNFEAAMKRLDVGAAYDMLSSRTRAQIDQMLNQVKAQLEMVPDSLLEQIGLDGMKDMSPREIMVTAIERAKEMNPAAVEALKSLHFVVLEVKEYGDEATVKVSAILNGQEQTNTVPLVREKGRWYVDSDETFDSVPMDLAPNIDPEACFTPT